MLEDTEDDKVERAGEREKGKDTQRRKSIFADLLPQLYEEDQGERGRKVDTATKPSVKAQRGNSSGKEKQQVEEGELEEDEKEEEEEEEEIPFEVKLEEKLRGLGYQLAERAGEGSVAQIYRAVKIDGKTEGKSSAVAVKILRETFRSSRNAQKLFKQEAELWMKLDHPNIAKVYHYDSDLHFMIQEYCGGGCLYNLFEEQRAAQTCFPILDVPKHGMELASALSYLHDFGAVHRDVKSLNILLGEDRQSGKRQIKLCDFGSAMLLSSIPGRYYFKPNISSSRNVFSKLANDLFDSVLSMGDGSRSAFEAVGTPYWMAPEMLDPKILTKLKAKFEDTSSFGDGSEPGGILDTIDTLVFDIQDDTNRPSLDLREFTKKLDVYSFGVVLYELFHRAHPWFEEDTSKVTRDDVKRKIVDKQERLPLAPYLSKELRDLTSACWHVDAEKRPSMYEVVERLKSMENFDLSGSIEVASDIAKAHLQLPCGDRIYLGDKEKTLLGRSSECSVRLSGSKVSREHAYIQLKANALNTYEYEKLYIVGAKPFAFEIVDTSTNGTKINRRPLVKKNPRALEHLDKIIIQGKVVATFYCDPN